MPPDPSHWRYPGPYSFRDNNVDRQVFFGRDEEVGEVLNRVLAQPLLVLYGKSGLGKTSLLQAGLFPLLRARHLLPIRLRFNQRGADWLDELRRSTATTCAELGIAYTPGEGATLWEYLNTALFSSGDRFLEPVLVLDQFEEIFTLQASDYRQSLARQLGYVVSSQPPPEVRERLRGGDKLSHLAERPPVRLLLSLREEYVGTLQELAQALPGVLGQRFRLGHLQRDGALDAIIRPASLPESTQRFSSRPFSYQPAAVDELLDFLQGTHGEIEPFQLQVLCSHVERQVAERQRLQAEPVVVDAATYLDGRQGMLKVQEGFYRQALSKLPGGVWQRRKARQLCEQGLLSPEGYRESLGAGQIRRRYGLRQAGLDRLVEGKVLRREDKLDTFYYEICHDSLARAVHQTRQARLRRFHRGTFVTMLLLVAMLLLAGFVAWQWRYQGTEIIAAKAIPDTYIRSVQALLDHGRIKRPEMVGIPAGSFVMGSQEHQVDEQPVRSVTVAAFVIGKYEVTFEEYDQFVIATGRDLPDDRGWGREKRPVINISWDDAAAYAQWLTEKTPGDKPYRLPSEAEWEYAARGFTTTSYWWGKDIREGGKVWAACLGCGSQWDNNQTAPVGQFTANLMGLHDTAGNVWEWVQDCSHENYEGAPRDARAWTDGKTCARGRRVIRGGSWYDIPVSLRSATRYWALTGTRGDNLGFRLAQDIK